MLLLTLVWAVSEAGSDFWSVGSRIWIGGLLAVAVYARIRRKLWDDGPRAAQYAHSSSGSLGTAAVLLSMIVNLNSRDVATLRTGTRSPQNSGEWDALAATHGPR